MPQYKMYIDGKWLGSKNTFPSLNPATEKVIGYFPSATKKDVEMAVNAAEHAQKKWSEVPAPKRGEILLKIAQLLRQNKERLARIETTEMGKVLQEARGDVQEAIDITEYMAGEGRRLFGFTTPR